MVIQGTNNSAVNVDLSSISISFFSGELDSALFANKVFAVKATNTDLSNGTIDCQPLKNNDLTWSFTVNAAGTQTDANSKVNTQYNLGLAMVPFQSQAYLTIPPIVSVTVRILGTVGSKGTYSFYVTENWLDDKKRPWDQIDVPFSVEKN